MLSNSSLTSTSHSILALLSTKNATVVFLISTRTYSSFQKDSATTRFSLPDHVDRRLASCMWQESGVLQQCEKIDTSLDL